MVEKNLAIVGAKVAEDLHDLSSQLLGLSELFQCQTDEVAYDGTAMLGLGVLQRGISQRLDDLHWQLLQKQRPHNAGYRRGGENWRIVRSWKALKSRF